MFVLAGIWREGKHGGKIKNPIPIQAAGVSWWLA
jgi:hypothetical protein